MQHAPLTHNSLVGYQTGMPALKIINHGVAIRNVILYNPIQLKNLMNVKIIIILQLLVAYTLSPNCTLYNCTKTTN